MLAEPKLEDRKGLPYVGIRKQVSMQELGTVLPPLAGAAWMWLSLRAEAAR